MNCAHCSKRLSRKSARLIDGVVMCSKCMFTPAKQRKTIAVDRNPKGQDRHGLGAQHESANSSEYSLNTLETTMTPNETSPDQAVEAVAVTQADRDAAASYLAWDYGAGVSDDLIASIRDGRTYVELIEAFARHRLSAIPSVIEPVPSSGQGGVVEPRWQTEGDTSATPPPAGDVEWVAQWLHDEGGFEDTWPHHTWPEHPDDTGQRDGGFVKIVPTHVQAKFPDVARRLLVRPPSAAVPPPADHTDPDFDAWCFGTVDPRTGMPLLTTFLHRVCANDEARFSEGLDVLRGAFNASRLQAHASPPSPAGEVEERVARAICKAANPTGDPDKLFAAGNPIGEYAEYPEWMLWLPEARTALELG